MRCVITLNLKKNKIWIWKILDRDTKQIIGVYAGNRSLKSIHNLWKSLNFKQHSSVYTDGYHVYTDYFDPEYLIQSKKYTSAIERNNNLQRQKLSTFTRKSNSTTRSIKNLNSQLYIFQHFPTIKDIKTLKNRIYELIQQFKQGLSRFTKIRT